MGRGPLFKRIAALIMKSCNPIITFGINSRFQELFPTWRQVTHAFLTLAPLMYCYTRSTCMPNPCRQRSFWARIKLSKHKLLKPLPVLNLFRKMFNLLVSETFTFQIYFSLLRFYDLMISNLTLGSSHYSIFKDHRFHPVYFIHARNFSVRFNLAYFCVLSNTFLKIFQNFFFQHCHHFNRNLPAISGNGYLI